MVATYHVLRLGIWIMAKGKTMTLIACQNCQNLMIVAEVGICTALDRDSVLMCFEDAKSKNEAFISHLKEHLQD